MFVVTVRVFVLIGMGLSAALAGAGLAFLIVAAWKRGNS